jgi:hypothetical protein
MEWHIDESTLPPKTVPQVRSLAEQMGEELKGFDHLRLRARWRGERTRNGYEVVVCDLSAEDSSGRVRGDELVFLPDFFTVNDPEDIRRNIRRKLIRFVDKMSDMVSENLDRIHRRLSEMAPVGEE